jgi:hypothetical protein
MCYAYIKEQSAAREGSVDQKTATIERGISTPTEEVVAARDRAEATSYARFLDKMRRMLAARKREQPTSV